jgi:hypothetical protein
MTQKYILPFNIDLEGLIAEDEGKTEEELLEAIEIEGDNHGVEACTEDMTVIGDIESLASFFMMLDGPGPSFNMEEFEDFVLSEGVIAPEKTKTPSDFPIDVALRYS